MGFLALLLVAGIIYFAVRRHQKNAGLEGWLEALLDYVD